MSDSQRPDNPASTPQPALSGAAAAVARRYARALYELAEERGAIDAALSDMRLLLSIVGESRETAKILAHPRLSRAAAIETARALAEISGMSELTRDFLVLLATNRRLCIASSIAALFMARVAENRGEHTAQVRSAKPLSKSQLESLALGLAELAGGGKVNLNVTEEPGLLGGLVVRMGSRFIDASLIGKLERMGRILKSQREAA